MQTDEDYVTPGAVHIAQNAEDFEVHRFRFYALKNRVGHPVHSSVDLIHRNGGLSALSSQDCG